MILWSLAVPFAIYLAVALVSTQALAVLLAIVATGYGLTAMAVILESLLAAPRRRAPFRNPWVGEKSEHIRFPKVTALIVAYLPNEKNLILDTVRHYLAEVDVPPDSLQVVLAYNTPEPLPVETQLADMARRDKRLTLVRVEESISKAQNLNAAVGRCEGAVVGVFDADHLPEQDCFRKALPWLLRGYDVVQGRCVIRQRQSFLSKLIGLEFGTMYTIAHTARSLGADVAIFGGSNGYWRRSRLALCSFDQTMLTEDIDASMRLLAAGFRIVHDRSIVSSELPPASLRAWLLQRLRWAQGWHQATRRHAVSLLVGGKFTWRQRVYLAYTFPWREIHTAVAPQALPMLIAIVVVQVAFGGSWYWDSYLTGTTILTFVSGTYLGLAAWKHYRKDAEGVWVLVTYLLASPVLALLRSVIALTAWVEEGRSRREWVVTERPSTGASVDRRVDAGTA